MDHRGAPGSGNDGCWALPPFHERAPLASPRGLLDGRRLRCLRLKSSSPCHVVGNSAITPLPTFGLGFTPHIQRKTCTDLRWRPYPVDTLLHLAIASVAPLCRIRGGGQQLVVKKREGL